MGQAFHRQAMDAFRLYMVVGGMPQAVKKYVETKDFDAVDAAKRDVLTIYRNDIFNYASEIADKVASIFDQIPPQLSKHEKKFRLSALKPGAKYRDWDNAFFWLKDARVVNICYNSTEPNIGLKMNEDRTTLKCLACCSVTLLMKRVSSRQRFIRIYSLENWRLTKECSLRISWLKC